MTRDETVRKFHVKFRVIKIVSVIIIMVLLKYAKKNTDTHVPCIAKTKQTIAGMGNSST